MDHAFTSIKGVLPTRLKEKHDICFNSLADNLFKFLHFPIFFLVLCTKPSGYLESSFYKW